MDENQLDQVVSSVIQRHTFSPPLIVILVIIIGLVLAMIFFFFISNRDRMQIRRLLFRLSTNIHHNTSTRTIESPNNRGQFEPAVWCRICNKFIDHVDNLCPHVGRRFYFSILYRRYYEFWRQRLHQHYRSADEAMRTPQQPSNTNRINLDPDPALVPTNITSNITIDLEELIGCDRRQESIERTNSTVSIISANPCQTSTPTANRDRFRRRVIERQESTTSFDRIRQMWTRFSGRSVSSVSSGVGSSIRSRESQEEPVQNNRSGLRKFFMKNRRCVSDLNSQRPTSTTRLIRRPTTPVPVITLQRPTPPPRRRCPPPPPPTRRRSSSENRMNTIDRTSNLFLQPNGSWDGQQEIVPGPNVQRSTSQPGDTSNFQMSQHYSNADVDGPVSISVRRIQRYNASTDLALEPFSIDSSNLFANPNQFIVPPMAPLCTTSYL